MGTINPIAIDVECYPNYFLVSCQWQSGSGQWVTQSVSTLNDRPSDFGGRLSGFLDEVWRKARAVGPCEFVSFNGLGYDLPMIDKAVCMGESNTELLHKLSVAIIEEDTPPYRHFTKNETWRFPYRHVDLSRVAPGFGGLKTYGGRMHVPKLQTLPFDPMIAVSEVQSQELEKYCGVDLDVTLALHGVLKEPIALRQELSDLTGLELHSASDAQIGERVVVQECEILMGQAVERQEVEPHIFSIEPLGLRYWNEPIRDMAEKLERAEFNFDGKKVGFYSLHKKAPVGSSDLQFEVAGVEYSLGMGGLHSVDAPRILKGGVDRCLIDLDVSSFYPHIITKQGLYPSHIGAAFKDVYGKLVERRLDAKAQHHKSEADSLKIAINGCFGKLGNKYSKLFDPKIFPQVTISGQLLLLRLIDELLIEGLQVESANTDGVVVSFDDKDNWKVDGVVQRFERDTGMPLERTDYSVWGCRDVNNYFAIELETGKVKGKGVFARVSGETNLMVNPQFEVCANAVVDYVRKGVPIEETVRNCKQKSQFVTIRKVKGGAFWRGEELGSVVRWYRATNGDKITYPGGGKVPLSDSSKPLMNMGEDLMTDIDYEFYIQRAQELLWQMERRDVEETGLFE